MSFTRYFSTFEKNPEKRIKKMQMDLVGENFTGVFRFTDIMLQAGRFVTGHVLNTQEMTEQIVFTIDETETGVGGDVYLGDEPQVFESVTNRWFNVVGRGHETIVLPNVWPEDYMVDLATTGLDLVLYAKDDYDLARISTMHGSKLPENERPYRDYPDLEDHPLHYRYTRQFFFPGGRPGDELRFRTSLWEAVSGGQVAPLGGISPDVGDGKYPFTRQRFMVLPHGSIRVRIEFYKEVEETYVNQWGSEETIRVMKDAGIGYQGIAEFTQWRNGDGRL